MKHRAARRVAILRTRGVDFASRRAASAIACFAVLALAGAGCSSSRKTPEFGGLYNRAAMYHGPVRNPVVVIPGLLGSKLENPKTGEIGWGASTGNYADPETPAGARTAALPMSLDTPLAQLVDDLQPAGALDRVKLKLVGVPLTVSAYAGILGTLGVGGYRDSTINASGLDYGKQHFTCFQFDYDWRRDNVEAARRLHHFPMEKRAYIQAERRERGESADNVKFDIVAHSMGGLVARYYLMYGDTDLPADGSVPPVTWAGRELVDRVILVGTPNAGAPQSLEQLINGFQIAPTLPKYSAAILGTMPAAYELLPRPRHKLVVAENDRSQAIDFYDPKVWEHYGWGLAAPNADGMLRALLPDVDGADARHRIALDHLEKCLARAKQFHQAMDAKSDQPADVALYLVAGDAVRTASTLAVNTETGRPRFVDAAAGDGIVLRSSALLDERVGGEWAPTLVSPILYRQVTFLFVNHLDLTRDEAFIDNVLFVLLESQRAVPAPS